MPHELPFLKDLIVLLTASIIIAYAFSRLRLPVIIGFIIAGILIGPSALGLIQEAEAIEVLAEIGVVLLLFTIGLEFSFIKILEMKRLVLWGGGLQVILTILLTTATAYLLKKPLSESVFF